MKNDNIKSVRRTATIEVDLPSNRISKNIQDQIFDTCGKSVVLAELYARIIQKAVLNSSVVKATIDSYTKQQKVA